MRRNKTDTGSEYENRKPLDREAAAMLLPQVGDRLWKIPSWLKWDMKEAPPRSCVVVAVHEQHRWYLVRYDRDGLLECFQVPEGRSGEYGD